MNYDFRNMRVGLKGKNFQKDLSESTLGVHESINFGTSESIHTEYESVHRNAVKSI